MRIDSDTAWFACAVPARAPIPRAAMIEPVRTTLVESGVRPPTIVASNATRACSVVVPGHALARVQRYFA
jgi:hypothetical protein